MMRLPKRYDILSERDLMEAVDKRKAHICGQDPAVTGKVVLFQQKEVNQSIG